MADTAYLLGLMPRTAYNQIKIMAHIRNAFAHNYEVRSFADLADKDQNTRKTLSKFKALSPFNNLIEGARPLYFAMFSEIQVILSAALVRSRNQQRQEAQTSDFGTFGRAQIDVKTGTVTHLNDPE